MKLAHIIPLDQLDWQPHPTIAGVMVKLAELPEPKDVLLATVEPQHSIPWHVHADAIEIAYLLNGQGILKLSATEDLQVVDEHHIQAGQAMVIQRGVWHTFINNHTQSIELFALHTSAQE